MAKKKKKNKSKGLFDHLNEIKKGKDPDYWDSLTESDRKSFSQFMLNRFLSMNTDLTEVISQLQPLTYGLDDRHYYRLMAEVLPYDGRFHKYISNKNSKDKYPDWVIERLVEHYECSESEAKAYYNVFLSSEKGKKALVNLFRKYGEDDKTLKKVEKLEVVGS